jgi:hypothetical protein
VDLDFLLLFSLIPSPNSLCLLIQLSSLLFNEERVKLRERLRVQRGKKRKREGYDPISFLGPSHQVGPDLISI